MAFIAPIPGQSLTDEPGNAAWERPPKITDPNEAVMFHLDKLSNRKVTDAALYLMDFGYPVDTLTKSILTGAVGEGMHTVDISMLIAPIIEQELIYMGTTAGIDVVTTLSDDDIDDAEQENKLKSLLVKKIGDGIAKLDTEFVKETVAALGENGTDTPDKYTGPPTSLEDIASEETVPQTPIEESMGLMSRGI
jgi:hypothetical protein